GCSNCCRSVDLHHSVGRRLQRRFGDGHPLRLRNLSRGAIRGGRGDESALEERQHRLILRVVSAVHSLGVSSGAAVGYPVVGAAVHDGVDLSAGDVVVGAELGVGGWVAAAGDVGVGQPGDVVVEDVGVGDVVEFVGGD